MAVILLHIMEGITLISLISYIDMTLMIVYM